MYKGWLRAAGAVLAAWQPRKAMRWYDDGGLAMTAGRMLITGAAKRIGAELARAFGADGWHLILHYNSNHDAAQCLKDELAQRGMSVSLIQADLSDEGQLSAMMNEVLDEAPLDVLVNNASLFSYDDSQNVSYELISRHMAVNLAAPAVLSRMFAAQSEPEDRNRRRCIINMLDAKLFGMNPDYFSYTMSKSALLNLTQISAQAYAPTVRVNGIAPGITLPSGGQTQAEFERSHQNNLLGKGADISEIVAAMRLILASQSMTGEVIVLDGGAHLRPPARDVAFL